MTKSIPTTLLLALGLLWLLPVSSARADCHEEPQVEEPPDDSFPGFDLGWDTGATPGFVLVSCQDGSPDPGHIINTRATKGIIRILQGADRTCDARIDLRYRIDCLRLYYLKVAANLPDSGDYLPIKTAMLDAAGKLDAIVTKYEDGMAPPLRLREGHRSMAKRLPPVRAVKEGFVDEAAAEAAAVVKETELIIIRSGGDPARRTQAYTDVAAAVEDNLVILRSA